MRTKALLAVLVSAILGSWAHAQSTAFTYQGSLKNAGTVASGLYDVRFRLYDSLAGGTQVGSTQCIDNVQVTQGLFTAPIDFGPQFISTASRYLEIDVRGDTGLGCSNTTGYTTLSPRQAITAAPRATAATTANALAIPNGSSVLVNLTNNGLVGIGTAAPTSQLHLNAVQDAFKISGFQPFMTMVDTNAANARVLLQNESGRYFVVSESFLNGTNSGGFTMVDQQGRLGLGVFDPQGTLDVGGRVQLRGAGGASSNSAGIYLASPMSSPTIRAFVGLLDDSHVGLFGSGAGWSLNMDTLSGNVGVGTTTPSARLEVRGDIRVGPSGQFYAAAGEENLRIIRGTISSGGLTIDGSGFIPTQDSTGHYHIAFTVPFASPPSVTLSVITTGDEHAFQAEIRNSISTTGFDVITNRSDTGDYHSMQFTMIAVGPR